MAAIESGTARARAVDIEAVADAAVDIEPTSTRIDGDALDIDLAAAERDRRRSRQSEALAVALDGERGKIDPRPLSGGERGGARDVKPRALTETSSAVPAPAGRAFRLAEEITSLPMRKSSSAAVPSSAGRRKRSRPENFALNLSMLASRARMAAPLASIVAFCPPEALSKAMSALSAPPSFCSASAEKSSRSGAAKVSRPVAPPSLAPPS